MSRTRVAVVRDADAALAAVDLAAALPACTILANDAVALAGVGPSPAAMGAALSGCDTLLLDLAGAASLRRVVDALVAFCAAPAGAANARPDVVVVDVSPVPPDVARGCAERLHAAGIDYAGAALVRRGATAYVAYIDAGAPEQALSVLRMLADPVLSVGGVGSAKLVRILDATMAAVNAAVTAEALGIVARLGLSDTEVVSRISLGSGAHAGLAQALDGDDGPSIDAACDDINMALELSRVHRRSTFFAAAALSALRGASGIGLGHRPLREVRQWLVRGATRGNGALT